MTLSTTDPQIISEEDEVLKTFLELPISSAEGVFALFRTLPGAVEAHGTGKEGYLFVPGTREDRCVLAAHADTVYDRTYWDEDRIFVNKPVLKDGIYQGTNPDASIGADDRSGCAILWLLRNSGHSLLILDGEEHRQVGAHYLTEKDPELFRNINNHTFMIELDRRGNHDYRTYQLPVCEEFSKFIEEETGFDEVPGKGRTDICVLCSRICGVNLSVGYSMEHTPQETLSVADWKNTLGIVRNMVSKPLKQYLLVPFL